MEKVNYTEQGFVGRYVYEHRHKYMHLGFIRLINGFLSHYYVCMFKNTFFFLFTFS